MMAQQADTVAQALRPTSPWSRHIEQTYGGRSMEDVSAYWEMRGYRRNMGQADRAPSGSFGRLSSPTYKVGMNMRGGGTPSDPGGYNWDTLKSGLDTAASAVSNIFKLNQYRQTTKQQPLQPLPPPSKPRSARSTVQKPKTTRPTLSTYDPSIW